MIKVYGMPTCPYCEYVHEQIVGREDEFEYINIGENIRNMSAFTRLRDNNPVFDRMKAIGDVGIPAFVFEDGRVSIDPADAGLIEYGTADACSIEDHKNGRKGCCFTTRIFGLCAANRYVCRKDGAMKSLLIKDTTREERIKIVNQALWGSCGIDCEFCSGCDNRGGGRIENIYQPYIDGVKELREINEEYRAPFVRG